MQHVLRTLVFQLLQTVVTVVSERFDHGLSRTGTITALQRDLIHALVEGPLAHTAIVDKLNMDAYEAAAITKGLSQVATTRYLESITPDLLLLMRFSLSYIRL